MTSVTLVLTGSIHLCVGVHGDVIVSRLMAVHSGWWLDTAQFVWRLNYKITNARCVALPHRDKRWQTHALQRDIPPRLMSLHPWYTVSRTQRVTSTITAPRRASWHLLVRYGVRPLWSSCSQQVSGEHRICRSGSSGSTRRSVSIRYSVPGTRAN